MINPRLIYGYLSDGATATADSTASGDYDPSNAVALERATLWRAGGTGTQRLLLHAGSAIAPSGLAICGGNYSAWGTTKLEYSDTGLAGSWTTQLTLSGLGSLSDSAQDYFAKLTSAPSKAWWSLLWSAPSAAPELSVFYLGTLVTLAEAQTYPIKDGPVFGVNMKESEGRIVNAEQVARTRMRFNPMFEQCGVTLEAQILALLMSEGGPLRPYFWVPMDESGSNDYGRAYLVRYQGMEFIPERIFADPWNTALPMLEEV